MKKIFILVLIALFVATTAFAYIIPSPGIGDKMGQGKFPSDPHKTFRLVRYVPLAGASVQATNVENAASVDSVMIWDTASDDGVTVTLCALSGDTRVAGVAAVTILTPEVGTLGNTAAEDIGKRNWGWIQTYGPAEVSTDASTAGGEGDALAASGSIGYAGSTAFDNASAKAKQSGFMGFYMNEGSAASGTNVKVFLKGLD